MQSPVDQTRQNFIQSCDRMQRLLAETPEERIHWSPSPTARTPIGIVAHAAWAIHNLTEAMKGRPFTVPTTKEADQGFREWEQSVTSRQQAQSLLEEYSAAFLVHLESLNSESLRKNVILPFGMGEAPAFVFMNFPAMHTQAHIAQLEYLQTIYGDHDWHM